MSTKKQEGQKPLANQLERLGAAALAQVLTELAEEDQALSDRLEGLTLRNDPVLLAKALRRRLTSVRRGRRFIPYRESFAFSLKLDAWLADVEEGLMEEAPEVAVELLERFLQSDTSIFHRVDDSGGSVGFVFRRACGLWAQALGQTAPSRDRVDRVYDLHAENSYGVRDGLLDEVAVVLNEFEMRRLATRYEQDVEDAMAASREGARDFSVFSAVAAMGQVACALEDAKLYERSVRVHSPDPNHLQLRGIAENYLRFGPTERAVELLEDSRNLDLLVDALTAVGDTERLRDARKRLFEKTLYPGHLEGYVALLPESDQEAVAGWAVELALGAPDLGAAVRLLLSLGEVERAEGLIVDRSAELGGGYYGGLLALAELGEEGGSPLIESVCLRALTEDVLDAGRTKAYRHARRYCARLQRLEDSITDRRGLTSHDDFMALLREKHGRKYSFWKLIKDA